MKTLQTVQTVRCSNCGNFAERHYLSTQSLIRTQCEACDYLLITCSVSGKVIEAYAPGLHAENLQPQAYTIAFTCEARS